MVTCAALLGTSPIADVMLADAVLFVIPFLHLVHLYLGCTMTISSYFLSSEASYLTACSSLFLDVPVISKLLSLLFSVCLLTQCWGSKQHGCTAVMLQSFTVQRVYTSATKESFFSHLKAGFCIWSWQAYLQMYVKT